jgi:hypothetical protein
MVLRLPTLPLAVAALLCAASPAAAHHIRYKADYRATGTWSESVRADLDEGDRDGDGREEVSSRETEMRFTLTASIPSVGFHKGRLMLDRPKPESVTHDLALEMVRSTVTEPNGESGACTVFDPGAGGSAQLMPAGRDGLDFRPAGDVIFQASCKTPMLEWPFHPNVQKTWALDAIFALPKNIGARRIEIPVAKPAPATCPVEDPGHTVACEMAWTGTVVFERLPDAVTIGTPRVKGRHVLVPITTATGTRIKKLRRPSGTRLVVRDGDLTQTFTIKR